MNEEIEEYFSRSRDLLLTEAEEASANAQEILAELSKCEVDPQIAVALKLAVESIKFSTLVLKRSFLVGDKDGSLNAAEGYKNASKALSKIHEMVLSADSSEIVSVLNSILASLEIAHKAAESYIASQDLDS